MTLGEEKFWFDGMHEAYPVLRDHIAREGRPVAPRGEPTTEVLGASFAVRDAVRRGVPLGTGRKVGVKMMGIDGTGNLAGTSDAALAIALAPVMDRFADDAPAGFDEAVRGGIDVVDALEILDRPGTVPGGRFFQGAYGPRIGDQLERVEQQLRRDPDTRQAVVSLWSETDREPSWKDRPCTTEFQLMLRDGRLDVFVFMRANDLWTGTCYDVFQFGQVQAAMAHVLGVPWGTYHHYATSLHVYERDWEKFGAVQRWREEPAPPPVDSFWAPAVENPRESWGPDWESLEPGEYPTWRALRDRFKHLLECAHHELVDGKPAIAEVGCFEPANPVEEWYWAVMTTGRAPY